MSRKMLWIGRLIIPVEIRCFNHASIALALLLLPVRGFSGAIKDAKTQSLWPDRNGQKTHTEPIQRRAKKPKLIGQRNNRKPGFLTGFFFFNFFRLCDKHGKGSSQKLLERGSSLNFLGEVK